MQVDLHLASKTVNQMSVREFFYRAALYGAIILLFLAIIGLIIAKIVKWVREKYERDLYLRKTTIIKIIIIIIL